jgi:hypothetical protein
LAVLTSMTMETSVHLGRQLVHEDTTRVDRAQERVLRLTRVEPGRRLAGEVTYLTAEVTMASGEESFSAAAPTQQPVAGKTYLVERQGDELRITSDSGGIPPQEEFEIVWYNMESLGKPNPLADFLAGRTVAVGDLLELPTEAATRLLAFGDDVVQVERFTLTLKEVQVAEGRPRAVFDAFVSSRSQGRSQMGMQVEGTLAIDASTCRVLSLELAGPVGLTETKSNGAETYLVSGRGKLRVAMRGEYRVK